MTVTIKINISDRVVKFIWSPLFLVVAALQGVTFGFAPLFLFMAGRSQRDMFDPYVICLFSLIFLMSLFYVKLGGLVIDAINASKEY